MYKIDFVDNSLPDFVPEAVVNTITNKTMHLPIFISIGGHHRQGPRHYTFRSNDSGMYDLLLTQKGGGTLEFLGQTYALEPGDLYYVNASLEYSYRTSGDVWHYMYMHLYGPDATLFYNMLFADGFQILHSDLQKSEALFEQIYALTAQPTALNQLEVSRLLSNFFHEAASSLYSVPSPEYTSDIERAVHFISGHFHNPKLQVRALAATYNFTQEHFIRKFKQYTGKSVYSYITDLRINAAKHMLVQTEKTLYSIAAECGFGSEAAMIKAFKRHLSLTPTQYRKLNLEHANINFVH